MKVEEELFPPLKKEESNHELPKETKFGKEKKEVEIEDEKQIKKQKIGRNIMSNIIKSFLKYLNSEEFLKNVFPVIKEIHSMSLN